MGGVAVLQPHDFLREVPRVRPNGSRAQPIPRRKRNPNTSPPSRAAARSNINKGSPNGTVDVPPIRILKRGESLPETAPPPPSSPPPAVKASDLGLKRHIPKPAQPRTKPAPFYAGSACITSPPPSSLPLPAFAKKVVDDAVVDPTRGLQRLLGLEL